MCQACQNQKEEVKILPIKDHARLMEMFTKQSVNNSLMEDELKAAKAEVTYVRNIANRAVTLIDRTARILEARTAELTTLRSRLGSLETALQQAGVSVIIDSNGDTVVSIKLS